METIKKGENKFYMGENERDPIADINFYPNGEKEIIIEHVYVSRALRRQGIGKILVDKVVKYAREEHKKINPVCSYAEKVLMENKDYADILTNTDNEI